MDTPFSKRQPEPPSYSNLTKDFPIAEALLTLVILYCNRPAQINTKINPHEIPNIAKGTAIFPIETMK